MMKFVAFEQSIYALYRRYSVRAELVKALGGRPFDRLRANGF